MDECLPPSSACALFLCPAQGRTCKQGAGPHRFRRACKTARNSTFWIPRGSPAMRTCPSANLTEARRPDLRLAFLEPRLNCLAPGQTGSRFGGPRQPAFMAQRHSALSTCGLCLAALPCRRRRGTSSHFEPSQRIQGRPAWSSVAGPAWHQPFFDRDVSAFKKTARLPAGAQYGNVLLDASSHLWSSTKDLVQFYDMCRACMWSPSASPTSDATKSLCQRGATSLWRHGERNYRTTSSHRSEARPSRPAQGAC